MGVGGVGVLRGRPPDVAAEHDHRRLVLDTHGPAQRSVDLVGVVGDLAQVLHVPAVGLEALGHVVAVGQLGRAVDADVVVVVDVDEPAQAEVAGEGRRFVADALLEIAVAADDERVVVADLGTEASPQPALGDAHAHGVGEALSEGTGGDLDARRVVHLGMSRRATLPLAELLEILQGEPVAGQVEHGVLQDAGVARRENEAVAVRPRGIGRVVAHDARPEDVGQRRQRHRCARVPGVGPLGRVHGQAPDDVDAQLLEVRLAQRAPPVCRRRLTLRVAPSEQDHGRGEAV